MSKISKMAQNRPIGLRCGFDELPRRLDMNEAVPCNWEMIHAHRKRGTAVTSTSHTLSLESSKKSSSLQIVFSSRRNEPDQICLSETPYPIGEHLGYGQQPAQKQSFVQQVKAKQAVGLAPTDAWQELAKNKRPQAVYQAAQLVKRNLQLCIHDGQLYSYSSPVWKPIDQHGLFAQMRLRCPDGERIYSMLSNSDQSTLVRSLLEDAELIRVQEAQEPNTRFLCLDDGVYDVEEQTIREASPEWFFTSALPVTIEDIRNPVNHGAFDQFLDNCTNGLPKVRQRLLEVIGTLVSNDMPRNFFVFQGKTSTGKSVVGDLVRSALLGESACLALNSPAQLRENHISGSMVDKKLLFCMDLPDGRFDPATVGILKQLTGDPNNMTANQKHVQQRSFKSHCKVLFSSNFSIRLRSGKQDEAFFDRMISVPFFNSVPKAQRDLNLLEKMKTERGYIFLLAMKALRNLRSNNFVFTEIEQEIVDSSCPVSATAPLNEQQELALHQFVTQHCVIKPEAEVLCAELYQAYQKFCIQIGSTLLTNTAFGSKLRRLYPSLGDCRHTINGKQHRFVTGLSLLDGSQALP